MLTAVQGMGTRTELPKNADAKSISSSLGHGEYRKYAKTPLLGAGCIFN
jgi:hypothetical protein